MYELKIYHEGVKVCGAGWGQGGVGVWGGKWWEMRRKLRPSRCEELQIL